MPILLQFKIVSGRLRNLFLTKAFADHVSTANESVTPEYDHTGARPGPAPSQTMSHPRKTVHSDRFLEGKGKMI